jgi:hypothetical protein
MFPLTFEWKKQGNLPYATNFDKLCIVDGKVYVSESQRPGILEYNPDTDAWVDLPTPTKGHGMVSHNGKLTLVGGLTNESRLASLTSKIQVWDSDSKQWTEPYPPMTIEQTKVDCASYQHYLIIVGWRKLNKLFGTTTSVEILDTKSGQWFKAPPMLQPKYYFSGIQSMVIGKSLYINFMLPSLVYDNINFLWRVSLPTLISHTIQGKHHVTSILKKMPNVPHYHTALFSIGNMLLTAGGLSIGLFTDKTTPDIHLFNPHTNKWLKIGELPEPRSSCACTVLPSGKLLVAGGQGNGKHLLPTVYTATIAGSYFEPVHF